MNLTRRQARQIDQMAIHEIGIASIILMENAGRSVAEFILNKMPAGPIVICCGKGNNGGDGFVIARHLEIHKQDVHILLFANPESLSEDAKINYQIALKSKIKITIVDQNNFKTLEILNKAAWIVDALFGTGLEGQIKPPFDKIIQAINQTNSIILAVDIPSGLDCDSGEPLGIAIQATFTLTFVGNKIGFTNPIAKQYIGEVHIVNIGIPNDLFE